MFLMLGGALSFIVGLVGILNFFNAILTGILSRRREFAMLKSVGMTQKGFRWMMNYECLLYGSKALLLGLPVSCGITYGMTSSTQSLPPACGGASCAGCGGRTSMQRMEP